MGNTCFHTTSLILCFSKCFSVVDNIIEINSSTINDTDTNGNSPLHRAAESGNADVIKYLLKSGASINDKNALGLTPIQIAANYGQTEAVQALIWGGKIFFLFLCEISIMFAFEFLEFVKSLKFENKNY